MNRLASVLALALTVCPALALEPALVVRGKTVHTVSGPPIADGVVVIRDGKIAAVGSAASVEIPQGATILDAAVVTPGLIDAHTVVGLAGYLNQTQDQDQLDRTEPVQAELRAIDAYNARERLVEWVRGFGVTTIHTGHGPGMLVAGQTMVVKTAGATLEDSVLLPTAMIAATLGEGAVLEDKTPGTRSKAVALLRAALIAAREYGERRRQEDPAKRPDFDLRKETLVRVVDGELPLLVTAQRHQDLQAALRVAEEFGLRLVLDGAAEAYLVVDEIRAANVPVIVHPTMARAVEETENLGFETAAKLADAGISIALQSGYESYVPKTRVVLFEAALAAAHGLGPERALMAITLGAARLLGVGERIGSLEPGKDGDLALFDGDPFEYTTHCVGVVIDGRVVSDRPR